MTLDDNYSPFEHLQSTIATIQNRIVSEVFKDTDDIWLTEGPTKRTPRTSLRLACTIMDSDSADMILMRLYLYYFCLRKAADLQPPVYGLPVTTFQETWRFQPQIKFYFIEDKDDVEPGYDSVFREFTIRLMNETSTTVSKANATLLAEKIRQHLVPSTAYRHHTGWHKATYRDKENGFDFRILTYSKADAKETIEKLMAITGHTPTWKLLSYVERDNPAEAFPISQPARSIYGQFTRAPRLRPVAWVRFKKAELLLHGRIHPITLVDLTGRRSSLA